MLTFKYLLITLCDWFGQYQTEIFLDWSWLVSDFNIQRGVNANNVLINLSSHRTVLCGFSLHCSPSFLTAHHAIKTFLMQNSELSIQIYVTCAKRYENEDFTEQMLWCGWAGVLFEVDQAKLAKNLVSRSLNSE